MGFQASSKRAIIAKSEYFASKPCNIFEFQIGWIGNNNPLTLSSSFQSPSFSTGSDFSKNQAIHGAKNCHHREQ